MVAAKLITTVTVAVSPRQNHVVIPLSRAISQIAEICPSPAKNARESTERPENVGAKDRVVVEEAAGMTLDEIERQGSEEKRNEEEIEESLFVSWVGTLFLQSGRRPTTLTDLGERRYYSLIL